MASLFCGPHPAPDHCPQANAPKRARLHDGNYFAVASATAVSSMRFEKPHSLSYQLDTFTRRPDTFVSVASNVDEAGL